MNRSSRLTNIAMVTACLALVAAVLAVPAGAATVIHFEKESLPAYEAQLHHGEVHAVAFHPGSGTGHLHISLNDGKHMTVLYSSGEQAKLVTQARAANARVQVATVKVAKTAPVKHKLRYIAAGILILVILVVLGVLLVGRRRTIAEDGQEPSGESAAP